MDSAIIFASTTIDLVCNDAAEVGQLPQLFVSHLALIVVDLSQLRLQTLDLTEVTRRRRLLGHMSSRCSTGHVLTEN